MNRVGVLALQGDYELHSKALQRAGCVPTEVRTIADLSAVDGVIVPGGESTTVARLMRWYGLDTEIKRRVAEDSLAVFGTCTGMILLAREIVGRGPEPLGLMNFSIQRNAYGRQVDSFETDLTLRNGCGNRALRAIFIRAPQVVSVGEGVEVLAEDAGLPVLLRQGRCLAASFHPELTEETCVHGMFLGMVGEKAA